MNGATVMMTVEQSGKDTVVSTKDAVNVWMEFDNTTEEAYVCLRELANWDGVHKDIQVVSSISHALENKVILNFKINLEIRKYYLSFCDFLS